MKKKVPSEKEIASKHGVSVDYVTRQAEIGSTVEREHVTTHEEAYGIALQHIMEFSDYYKHLLKMEKQLKSEHKKKKTVKEMREYIREEKEKPDKKFCKLCQKPETRDECSYGPKAWDRFSAPIPSVKK
jgi:hypothetical protein